MAICIECGFEIKPTDRKETLPTGDVHSACKLRYIRRLDESNGELQDNENYVMFE